MTAERLVPLLHRVDQKFVFGTPMPQSVAKGTEALLLALAEQDVDPVLMDHLRWLNDGGCAPRTLYERQRLLRRLAAMSGRPLLKVTDTDVSRYVGSVASGGTKQTLYSNCRQFYSWAFKRRLVEQDPTELVRKPRTPRREARPMQIADIKAALDTANPRIGTMIVLGLYQGLRCLEIATIRGEDIDLAAGELFVEGKGGVKATLPLHPDVAALARIFPREGYWYPSLTTPGHHADPASVSHAISKAFTDAGVPDGTAHRLRHTFGTAIYAQSKDIRATQDLLRHRWITTTQIYTQSSMADRRSAVHSLTI